jgi:cytochrome c oxidase subunit 1
VLFQHLFWFYSHPAVYIMILPPMGAISEVIACFSRKNVFGYSFVAFSSLAIAIFGFLVWAHHLFVAGISPYSAMVFSFLTYAVAVPSAVKTFNWTATLYRGAIWWKAPMIWVFGFIGLFLDRRPHRTLHRRARHRRPHPRHLLRGRALPLHHGRRRDHGLLRGPALLVAEDDRPHVSRRLAKVAALLVFVGFNMTFFPQFILGYLGMPRRYHMYPPEFQVLNIMSTGGATVLGIGYAAADSSTDLLRCSRARRPAPIRGWRPVSSGRRSRRRCRRTSPISRS